MKIQPITIPAKQNVKYLYNKVLDVVREEKVGGIFANDYIKLDAKESVLEKLKNFGIKFFPIKKC